jgi:predicted nucleotidyltransferase
VRKELHSQRVRLRGEKVKHGVEARDERRAQALAAAQDCIEYLKAHYGVKRVIVFGSLAGEGPWHDWSDIDLAVEGLPPENYMEALSACWELLPEGMELDLVPLEDAYPELRARILGEVEMPVEAHAALKKEIEDELHNLERVGSEMAQLLARMPQEPTFVELRATASILQDFYSGVERIFERVAIRLDGDLPPGPSWHTLLLRRMEAPFADVRPAVIDHKLALRLLDYLRFRHLFRHTYGYELEWDKCQPLAEGLERVLAELKRQLETFEHFLETKAGQPSEGS